DMPLPLQILNASQIDKAKWDERVNSAENGLIYSTAAYLDHICEHWVGIIAGDYEGVMALSWRRKFGIRYLYQPAFVQQLGWIGNNDIDAAELVSRVYAFSSYGDLLLNFRNDTLAALLQADRRLNYILDLEPGYNSIEQLYSSDLRANLRKAAGLDLEYADGGNSGAAIAVFREFYGHRMPHVSASDYEKFAGLCRVLSHRDQCLTRKVVNQAGELLAIALFLKDRHRIYNLMNTTTPAGRAAEANHFLLDNVIREFAGTKLIFDFEGSDIPGVQRFYKSFGPVEQPYFIAHYNRLPKLIRLLKR
ncbi:MAG TPA: GNAT family N-acetyltransferase, partial [Chitinophagaceae bacterium]